jgi:hypothetical protein
MLAQQSGSPTTYIWKRKQHIMLAFSGRAYSSKYTAFKLPDAPKVAATSVSAGVGALGGHK